MQKGLTIQAPPSIPLAAGVTILGISDLNRGVAAFVVDLQADSAVAFQFNKKLVPHNHDTHLTIGDLIPQLANAPIEEGVVVYDGGPNARDTLHMLHKDGYGGEFCGDTNIKWGGNYETLQVRVANGTYRPNATKVLIGYMGWEAGVLQKEVDEGLWLVVEAPPLAIFSGRDTYSALIKRAGNGSLWGAIMSNHPASVLFN